MKSASSSAPPPARNHLKRSRLLKRGCSYEPLNDSHLKYLWAAYKRGVFDWPGNMGPVELRAHVENITAAMLVQGGDVYTLIGETPQGKIPIGIMAVQFVTPPGAMRQAEPHVYFFPEASPRNKLECTVRFLIDLKKDNNVVIIAAEKDWGFFNHMCLYGVIRAVGKYRGFYEDGSHAMIYQDAKAL